MTNKKTSAIQIQKNYYAKTAEKYDQMREAEEAAFGIALDFMISALPRLGARSVLDIGSGTGRGV